MQKKKKILEVPLFGFMEIKTSNTFILSIKLLFTEIICLVDWYNFIKNTASVLWILLVWHIILKKCLFANRKNKSM